MKQNPWGPVLGFSAIGVCFIMLIVGTRSSNRERDAISAELRQALSCPMPLVAMKANKTSSLDGSAFFFLIAGGGSIHSKETRTIRMAYNYGGFVYLLEVPEQRVRFRVNDTTQPFMEVDAKWHESCCNCGGPSKKEILSNPTEFIVSKATLITVTTPGKYLPSEFKVEL